MDRDSRINSSVQEIGESLDNAKNRSCKKGMVISKKKSIARKVAGPIIGIALGVLACNAYVSKEAKEFREEEMEVYLNKLRSDGNGYLLEQIGRDYDEMNYVVYEGNGVYPNSLIYLDSNNQERRESLKSYEDRLNKKYFDGTERFAYAFGDVYRYFDVPIVGDYDFKTDGACRAHAIACVQEEILNTVSEAWYEFISGFVKSYSVSSGNGVFPEVEDEEVSHGRGR